MKIFAQTIQDTLRKIARTITMRMIMKSVMTIRAGQGIVETLDIIMDRMAISKRTYGISGEEPYGKMPNTMDSLMDVGMQTILVLVS